MYHQYKLYGNENTDNELPGEIVHNLCQLNRCNKIFESSVAMANKSFSGFHSAILIYIVRKQNINK